MSAAPFEELKVLIPVWELQNKANHTVTLELSGGDSVHFGPNARRKINALNLHQLPSLTAFEFITPSINDLVSVGIIKRNKPATSQVVAKPTRSIELRTATDSVEKE